MSHWQLLKRLIRGISRRRKRLAFLSFLAALIVAVPAAYHFSATAPRFRATATLLLESRPDRVPLFQEFSPVRPLAVQLAILKSRSLAEAVLEKLPPAAVQDLMDTPYHVDYLEAIHNIYLRWRGLAPEVPNPQRRALLELREGRLKLETGTEGLVWLSAEASQPPVAVDIVNTYIDVLLSRTRSFNLDDARVSRQFLEEQLAAIKQSLKASEDALRVFTTTNGGIRIPDRSQATTAQLSQTENAIAEVSTSRRMVQTRLQALREKVESQKRSAPAPAPAPVAPAPSTAAPEVQRLRTQLTQLELQLLDLKAKFTDEHPRVSLTRARIAEVQRELADAVKKATPVGPPPTASSSERIDFAEQVLALETATHTLVAQEDALRAQANALRSELSGLSQTEQQYSRLVREVETNRTLDALLNDKFNAARIREQGEMRVVKVIDPVSPPYAVTAERRARFLLGALALAMLVGIGIPTIVEWSRRTVETEEDVEAINLPVLALLPRLQSRHPKFIPLSRKSRKRFNDDSIFSEAFRNLRVAVQLGMHREHFRSVLITSPMPAEGKSTAVVNLGWAFAEAGTKVVVADIDLLRPALHKRFNVAASAGIAEALTSDNGVETALIPVADRLWIAPGGEPAETLTRGRLATSRLKHVLADIGRHADVVICDCSPLLLIPDNLFVATSVDAVIIVAKAGSTTCGDLARTKALLHGVGARVLGVVINEIPPSTLRRQYHHYYRSYAQSQAT